MTSSTRGGRTGSGSVAVFFFFPILFLDIFRITPGLPNVTELENDNI